MIFIINFNITYVGTYYKTFSNKSLVLSSLVFPYLCINLLIYITHISYNPGHPKSEIPVSYTLKLSS